MNQSQVATYRKRPVEVQAIRLFRENVGEVAAWCGGTVMASKDTTIVLIQTLEGLMEAREFDWVVRGVVGEFYPVRADVFSETYEAVAE